MMVIKLEDDQLIVKETHKSSRGGDYTYIVRDSKLMHISKLFRPSRKEDGEIMYDISIEEAEKVFGEEIELVEFSFSNRGHFYPKIYRINLQTKTISQELSRNREILGRYEFEILGSEYQALNEYERKVPPLIERVWEIEKKLDLEVYIRGARGEEVHEDPELAKFNSLVFPNLRSRTRSLKEKIRFAHELYVLMLVIDSVLNEPPEERTLQITHKDWPTLVESNLNPPVTVWYQFSIEDWTKVVWGCFWLVIDEAANRIAHGQYEEAEKLIGVKLPRNYAGAMKVIASLRSSKRIYVKPDIMVFKGEYRSRGNILENPPDKAVLIDAKVEMTQSDLKQLLEYRAKFPQTFGNIEFIVAAIEKMSAHYKHKLEREGYTVIELVFPNKPGENEFQEAIRKVIETWKE
ncbi:hypothetical protein [Thermococcus aciditolerans]|uniref:Uncharacterized protein n=1 Tax=Thermococcus aciditolerans TaxID=2598455 RepID=A0A5C0SL80_9EURY|nr:hypothetical protein [Thermococcus aciditolerans]QEK15235.1 hypothetical protein FPV09_09160 [Thermococcus aciditolerans]